MVLDLEFGIVAYNWESMEVEVIGTSAVVIDSSWVKMEYQHMMMVVVQRLSSSVDLAVVTMVHRNSIAVAETPPLAHAENSLVQ